MPQGFVYILVSPNSDHIKIGRTERPINERLRGVNGGEAYAPHGPWELSDFVHVTDCVVVEGALHRHFRDRNVKVEGTRELFNVAPHEAMERLRLISMPLRVDAEKTDQLFQNQHVILFLFHLSSFRACMATSTSKVLGAFATTRSHILDPRFVRPGSPPPHCREGISAQAHHERPRGTLP
jgi:hypothetical protein